MHRFFVPAFSESGDVTLPEDEARHLARVLRLTQGDTVAVFDGRGREAVARVKSVASRTVTVTILEPRAAAAEATVAVTLAQAVLKGDKMDGVIRDAVMLGVAAIQPVLTRRADVPRAALQDGVRLGRWARTALASVKQCGRAVVPPVMEVQSFEDLLGSTSGRSRMMFVEPDNAEPDAVVDLPSLEGQRPRDVILLIGPEGGWDPAEVNEARASGVTLVTFGGRVLRADAAALVALSVLRYLWRDF